MMGLFRKKRKTADEWFDLGCEAKDLEKKIEYYLKALEIDPKHAAAWTNRGIAISHLGKYEEAIGCYDKALKIDPKLANAWNGKGNVLGHLGKYEEAIGCYDKALKINPKLAVGVWINKGDTFRSLGKYEEAIRCFDKALEIDPGHEKAKQSRGIAKEKMREATK